MVRDTETHVKYIDPYEHWATIVTLKDYLGVGTEHWFQLPKTMVYCFTFESVISYI